MSNGPANSCSLPRAAPDLTSKVSLCSGRRLVGTHNWSKCKEYVSWNAQTQMGQLCRPPSPRLRGRHRRESGKTVRARVWEEQIRTVSCGHNRTTILMNAWQLWLPAQDQARQHPGVKERGGHEPPPRLRSYGQLMASGGGRVSSL